MSHKPNQINDEFLKAQNVSFNNGVLLFDINL